MSTCNSATREHGVTFGRNANICHARRDTARKIRKRLGTLVFLDDNPKWQFPGVQVVLVSQPIGYLEFGEAGVKRLNHFQRTTLKKHT